MPSRGASWGWRSSGRRACCCGARALFAVEQPWPALVAGSVAHLYSPYLLTNVYTRGAIAEVGAGAAAVDLLERAACCVA
ncbi:MAG: hypothetical protein R2851_18630 [Caldilineaceae bacterium]